jgi:hypothetical protein
MLARLSLYLALFFTPIYIGAQVVGDSIQSYLPDSLPQISVQRPSLPTIEKKNPFDETAVQDQFNKELLRQHDFSGSVEMFSDYGVRANLYSLNPKDYNAGVKVNTNLNLFGLPFNASLKASSLPDLTGRYVNFKFGYSKPSFQDIGRQAKENAIQKCNSELDSLSNLRQQLTMKSFTADWELDRLQLPELQKPELNIPDINTQIPDINTPDVLNSLPVPPTLDSMEQSLTDSLAMPDTLVALKEKIEARRDSLIQIRNEAREKVADLENKINKTKETINGLKSKDFWTSKLNQNKKLRFFSHIKALNVGRCNPSYSMIVADGVGINGGNIEYEDSLRYFAFSHGKLMRYSIQQPIQGRNMFSRLMDRFDDMRGMGEGRMTSFKLGLLQSKTHQLRFGMLFGQRQIGQRNTEGIFSGGYSEKNWATELEEIYNISEELKLQMVYAHSQTVSYTGVNTESGGLLQDGSLAGNAGIINLKYNNKKYKLKSMVEGSLTDAGFKSYGTTRLLPGRKRVKYEMNKEFLDKYQFRLHGRNEKAQFNSTKEYTSGYYFNQMGVELRASVNRHLKLATGLNRTVSKTFYPGSENGTPTYFSYYYGVAVWNSSGKKEQVITLTSGLLDARTDSISGHFLDMNIQWNRTLGKQSSINVQSSFQPASTTANNSPYLFSMNSTYIYKCNEKISLNFGGTLVCKNYAINDYGCMISLDAKIAKKIFINFLAEKVALRNNLFTFGMPEDTIPIGASLKILYNL